MAFVDEFLRKAGDAIKDITGAMGDEETQQPQPHEGGPRPLQPTDTNHRYQSSFAPSTGDIKWYVDGASYFWAVSMALEKARRSIYILDWWLSPELYLRRPPARNEQYRLDNMLKAAAERGVEVRVIVYKEVKAALSCDSAHTKHALEALHPNIRVFRHPDHIPNKEDLTHSFAGMSLNPMSLAKASTEALVSLYGSLGDNALFWAHHEKLCVVDHNLVFMGGLDMCFGRWDTSSHPIADAHPGNLDDIVFPGQDFNNARIFDFEGVDKWDHNQLDRTKNARMGWSDITVSMRGPIVKSLLEHFADRWNFIFDEKYTVKDPGKYAKISLNGSSGAGGGNRGGEGEEGHHHHHMFDDIRRGLHMGMRGVMGGYGDSSGERDHGEREEYGEEHGGTGRVSIQLCRSCCEWSAGHPTEHSIANAYIEAITNAEHFVYIENQFFITSTSDKQRPVRNRIGLAIADRIVRAQENNENFHIIVVMPAVPAFPGDLKADDALGTRAIMEFQYNSICRGGNSIIENVQGRGVEEWDRYIHFYNLRNYDRLNVSSAMGRAEDESGVRYEDARRDYDERYGGRRDDDSGEYGGGRERRSGDYERYQSAAAGISDRTWDTVSACYMDGGPDIRDVPWEGSEEAEMDAFVSEELYIHSKVLIADDRLVICGSANVNDRSQLGDHDSEIAVVIEDPEPVETTMGGRPFTASRFAASLRRHLFRKHLGLLPDQRWDEPGPGWTPAGHDPQDYDWDSRGDRLVADPLTREFWEDLWLRTARTNTAVFERAFHPVPTDRVRNWAQYDDFFERRFVIPGVEYKDDDEEARRGRVEYGHVVREEFPGGVRELKDELARVRGTLVEMPLHFLSELGEDLAMEGVGLNFATKEIYT